MEGLLRWVIVGQLAAGQDDSHKRPFANARFGANRSAGLLGSARLALMTEFSHQELVAALKALPERSLVEVVASALEKRSAEVCRPGEEDARLCLAEAHRFTEASGTSSRWELLVLARPRELGEFASEGAGPTQEGSCCGVTLAGFAKRIVCPLCGKSVDAT